MTIEMPEELRWLSYLAGSEWPEGDEDALFALAGRWREFSAELRGVLGDLREACDLAAASYTGEGADRMRAQFEMFFSGDQSVAELADDIEGLGEMVRDFGAQVESAKLQIIITLAITAIEIAYALSTLFGAAAIPAIEAASQGVIRTISQSLLRHLAARAEKYAAMPMWRLAVQEGLQEAAIGAAVELGVQGIQLAEGHIDELDLERVAIAGTVSGISGLVAAPIASMTAQKLSRWLGKDGLSMWKAGAIGVGSGIGAGVVGAGAGFVANGAITGDWTFTPAMVLGGLGGGLTGGVHGVASHYGNTRLRAYRAGGVDGGHSLAPMSASRSVETDGTGAYSPPDDRDLALRSPEPVTAVDILNNCGPLALAQVVSMTRSTVARVPDYPVGPGGMNGREFEAAAGAPLRRFPDHAAIGDQLLGLGDGSAALVVDTYRGPSGGYGVGAHTYVMYNSEGELRVVDPATDQDHPLTSSAHANIGDVHAVLYTSEGNPHLPAGMAAEADPRFGDVRIGVNLDPDAGTVFGPNLLAKLDSDLGGVVVNRGHVDPADSRPPSLPEGDALRHLSSSDRRRLLPAAPIPVRVADTGVDGAARLVLVDTAGREVRLPTAASTPAVRVTDGDGRAHYAFTGPDGAPVRISADLVGDFGYTPPGPEATSGTLSWNVPEGQVRVQGADARDAPLAVVLRGGTTVVAAIDGDGTTSIRLTETGDPSTGWARIPAAATVFPNLPVPAGRHGEALFGPRGPESEDARPGAAGDNRLLAAMKSLARQDPNALAEILHDYGDGTVGVRFFVGGRFEWVRVEKQIALSPDTGTAYFARHEPGQPLWPSMLAKAYAQRFGGGRGYRDIVDHPPHVVAERLGKGFHQGRAGGVRQPVGGVGDRGFLHPLRLDADTLHEVVGGDPGFARRAAETYDRWEADTRHDEQRLTPAGLRAYLDREFAGGRWRTEKANLVRYVEALTDGAIVDRVLPPRYGNVARWIGHRLDYALRRGTSVVLETRAFGAGRGDATSVAGLIAEHAYPVVGVERDEHGEPVRVLLENQWNHGGSQPRPADGIAHRYDTAARETYRPARGGGGYRVDTAGNRHWCTPDGRQGVQLPDGTRYGMLADGTRYRKDPDGTTSRTSPDGARYRRDPDGNEFRTAADGVAQQRGVDDAEWRPDPHRSIDPVDRTTPPHGGVVAVDLRHLPKFGRLDMAGAGAHGLYGKPLADPVRTFGARRDGVLDLIHLTPVPRETVGWLHEQVFAFVEGDRGADETFRAAVRKVLTPQLLYAEWPRLLSTSGLPLRVRYRGKLYPISLRLGLRSPRPGDADIAPVGIQRWAFGIAETSDTAGSGDVRTFSYDYSHTWGTEFGPLRSIGVAPGFDLVHNQLSSAFAVTSIVQPMILMRSKGPSRPFEYEMVWEFRPGKGPAELLSPELPKTGWRRAAADPPDERLVVWFPDYLATGTALPTINPIDPGTIPAPIDRLREEIPLYLPIGIPNHDRIPADVMASFGAPLRKISDHSAEQLREFFTEGNLRSAIPLAWGGSADSPTLYTSSGATIGFLRLTVEMAGGDEPTGPITETSVMESHVLRLLRMQGSSSITNSLGGHLSVSFGFGAPKSPAAAPHRLGDQAAAQDRPEPFGAGFTLRGGGAQRFGHTLNYGGNARMSHSLRTGEPVLPVTPRMTLRVTLIRPVGAAVAPESGTPLDGGHDYPVNLLVPSLRTLGHAPTETRYLPAELLHLTQLGVSTTPLSVDGVGPLFDDAAHWLSDHGFFPTDTETAGLMDAATLEATHTQRLNNVRKFEQMRTRIGLRSQVDEMIEGGAVAWFELPTPTGVRRVSLKLIAERRYPSESDPYLGTSHDWTIPKVQTLNYAASTHPGEEQFSKTPLAWNIGVDGSLTNPFGDNGSVAVQSLTPGYDYSGESATISGSGAGSGHEYYMLSPTENGTQIFTQTVRYRLETTYSHGPAPEPRTADGSIRSAVPTYRTLTEKPGTTPVPATVTVRERGDQDIRALAMPAVGRTLEQNVLKLPESALLDRVGGSKHLRRIVTDLIDDVELEIARVAADDVETPPVPGAFPAENTNVETRDDAGEAPRTSSDPGPVRTALSGSAHRVADAAGDIGRWIWRTGVGEPATNPESMAGEVTHIGLSPYHLNGNALRIFRDSYVLEGAATPGALAGTDISVEVTGYLTDVKVLPRPPKMDAERWLQSLTAANRTDSRERGHHWGLSVTGSYGKPESSFLPGGSYGYDTGTVDSSTVNDNTGVFRVTTEDTASVHRFSATAHYVVEVRIGKRNYALGVVLRGPHAERARVVEVPDGVEFLLVDNDLQNHPELLALVTAADSAVSVPPSNVPDRRLPAAYVDSGGELGFAAVTEVEVRGGRKSLQILARGLVEQVAPGVTRPGAANHVPGVLTRINEHTTSQALRTLPNAGPDGKTRFHFVDRSSWLGPHLVEVAFTARPHPDADLNAVLGKRVTETSGVDNIFGHSLGEGSALDPPGATRVDKVRQRGHRFAFAAGGRRNGHRPELDLSVQHRSRLVESQSSSRELRSWQRTFGETSEFAVPYRYAVEVRSRPLNEALSAYLVRRTIAGAALLGSSVGVLPALDLADLTEPTRVVRGGARADARIRFNTSETRATAPRADETTVLPTVAGIHGSDPSAPRPEAVAGEVVLEMETDADVRNLLAGPTWTPARPIEIYDFAGIDRLTEALRLVDPTLDSGEHTLGNRSSEGKFIRLTRLVADNRLTVLGPAATAAYLPTGSRDAPGPPTDAPPPARGDAGPTAVRITLYSPRIETTSKDTAIDRVEVSVDGFRTSADNTIATVAAFGLNSPYSAGGADRGGFTTPLTGGDATLGQAGSYSSQRREFLRFGTPKEKADGTGATGHRVRALALLEVRGPEGALWVTGDLLFRTTEAPPPLRPPRSEAIESEGAAEAEAEAEADGEADGADDSVDDGVDKAFTLAGPVAVPDHPRSPPRSNDRTEYREGER
ncbi:WXG100-like domain-containing protein [Nocardia takedensis]